MVRFKEPRTRHWSGYFFGLFKPQRRTSYVPVRNHQQGAPLSDGKTQPVNPGPTSPGAWQNYLHSISRTSEQDHFQKGSKNSGFIGDSLPTDSLKTQALQTASKHSPTRAPHPLSRVSPAKALGVSPSLREIDLTLSGKNNRRRSTIF